MANGDDGRALEPVLQQAVQRRLGGFVERSSRFIEEEVIISLLRLSALLARPESNGNLRGVERVATSAPMVLSREDVRESSIATRRRSKPCLSTTAFTTFAPFTRARARRADSPMLGQQIDPLEPPGLGCGC
jgi:hypothetical protein